MDPVRGHICRSCRLKLVTSSPSTQPRSFSTTTRLRIVPPESPYYVDIPSSHQAFAPYQPQPKGMLPTPRDIFPANRPERSTPEYIAKLTREPLKKNIKPTSKLSTTAKHKVKMANQRRTQLREGLTALQARKQADLTAMSSRSQHKQHERSNLLTQPERTDARLTNVSVPTAMHPQPIQTSLAALEAEVAIARASHARKLANHASFKAAKHSEKMDALHTLYMSARGFVTTEAQMREMLTKQFEEPNRFTNDRDTGDSMWHFGPPDSVKDMINDASGKPRKSPINGDMLSSFGSKAATRVAMGNQAARDHVGQDQERMKRIAEKLSGGKI